MAEQQNRSRTALGIVLISFCAAGLLIYQPFFYPADAYSWASDSKKVLECVSQGTVPCSSVSKFPLAYMLNALVIQLLGAFGFGEEVVLGALNLLFIVSPIALLSLRRYSGNPVGKIQAYGIAILLSPIPAFYLYTGALEVQAGVLLGIAIGLGLQIINSDVREHSWRLLVFAIVTAAFVPLYKDVNAIIAGSAIVGVILVRAYSQNGNSFHKLWPLIRKGCRNAWWPISGLIVGAGISILYNLFRYNSVIPQQYLREGVLTDPSAIKSAEFAAAILLSPNGGVLIFWGVAIVAILGILRANGMWPTREGQIASIIMVFLSVCGFANWWAPFGWDSWGNRLMVTPILACIVTLLLTSRKVEQRESSRRWIRHTGKREMNVLEGLAFGIVVTVSIYYVFVGYWSDKKAVFHNSLVPGSECSRMLTEMKTQENIGNLEFWQTDTYYDCARERFLHVPVPTYD